MTAEPVAPDDLTPELFTDLAADIRDELNPEHPEYRPVGPNSIYWTLTLPNLANYFDKAAAALSAAREEIAAKDQTGRLLYEAAERAGADLARARDQAEYVGQRIERAVHAAIAGDTIGVLAALSGCDNAAIDAARSKES